MIYKLTLLKDLPHENAGFTFFVKGNQCLHDGNGWFELYGKYKEIYDIRRQNDWVKTEETNLIDDRPHLQTLFPDIRLYNLKEMLDTLGWEYQETNEGCNEIKCCGESVYLGGFVGAEHGYCKKCKKGFQDMTGFIPSGNATVSHIDYDKVQYDDGRIFSIDFLPWN